MKLDQEIKACPVRGKKFIPAPMHAYRMRNKFVCSYSCVRAVEKAKEAKKKEKGGAGW